MNSSSRTMTFAGVAAVSALLAWGAWSASQPSSVPGFGDIGQDFFPDFQDAALATGLTVVDYDDDVKDAVDFSVTENDKGLWVIPSHHNYPAEAKDRLAKTATSLMGVKKTAVQSRLKDDWKRFGVIDPRADGVGTAEERGTRLTLTDGSDNPLVDLIIGNQVEGRSGHYFVREPEKDTTYVTELDVDLSAKFSDWIEPDLLKISSSDVVKVTLDNYSINETQGTVEGKEKLEFAKAELKTTGDWELDGLDDNKEELDASPVKSLVTNLDQLKIVGVRPKPEGLSDNLRLPAQFKQALQDQLDREMSARGFFFGGDKNGGKRLYSNEGDMIAGLSNGVEYSLYFGEIARGTGKDIEIGPTGDEAKKDKQDEATDADNDPDKNDEDGPRRYLFLKAGFNEALLGDKPVAPVEPVMPEILKEETKKESAEAKESEKAPPEKAAKEEAPTDDDAKDDDEDAFQQEVLQDEDPSDGATEAEEAEPETAADKGAKDVKEKKKPADAPVKESPAKKAPEKEKTKTPAADKKKQEPADKKPAPKKEPATDDAKKKKKEDKPEANKSADEKPKEKSDDKEPDAKKSDDKTPDEMKSDEKKQEAKPAAPVKAPKVVAQETYDKEIGTYEAEKRGYETSLKAYEAKVKTGKEKADELADRFAGWYYVISSDSFEKFRVTRTDVIKKKEAKEDETKTNDKETEAAK